jgi:hypothetical protein
LGLEPSSFETNTGNMDTLSFEQKVNDARRRYTE